MKLKLSRFYLNTLLAGLVGLLTLVLMLLYLIQSSDLFSSQRGVDNSEIVAREVIKLELKQKIGVLQNLNEQQTLQHEAQRTTMLNESLQLKRQVAELQNLLQQAEQARLAAETVLETERRQAEKLTLQLQDEKARVAAQQTRVNTSDSRLQEIEKKLLEEKQFTATVRAKHEQDKIRLLNLSNELADKKRELVRNKRQLAKNEQSLYAKTRELAISKGKQSDQTRQNQSLSRQVSLLNEELRALRQRIREPEIASTPGSQTGLN